jgi:hypothetical protein
VLDRRLLVEVANNFLAIRQRGSSRANLEQFIDRSDGCHNWPGGNREERTKEERFDGKLDVIFGREEMPSEFADGSTTGRCFGSVPFEDGSFNRDYAHD